jgi:cytochrome P450
VNDRIQATHGFDFSTLAAADKQTHRAETASTLLNQMPASVAAPGPKSVLGSLVYLPGRDPIAFFAGLARTYGDIVSYRMGGEQMFFVNDPQHIKDILVTNNKSFMKGRGLQRAKRVLGEGLLTSEGAMHLRQRRLMQPAFHRDRIAAYGATMVAHADRMRSGWVDGRTVDMAAEMNRLTLSIVGKTLFDADVESQAIAVREALAGVMDTFWMMMLPFADVIERLPVPKLRRARMARVRLDAIIYRMIADRRASGRDHGDLLSMLLSAQDEDDGGVMTDQQVRDEAMTIFLAGHETTANALTWLWYLVSGAPEVEARLHEEVDRVLQGRTCRRCRMSSASPLRRCACIRRRGSSAAARSSTTRWAATSCRRGRSSS